MDNILSFIASSTIPMTRHEISPPDLSMFPHEIPTINRALVSLAGSAPGNKAETIDTTHLSAKITALEFLDHFLEPEKSDRSLAFLSVAVTNVDAPDSLYQASLHEICVLKALSVSSRTKQSLRYAMRWQGLSVVPTRTATLSRNSSLTFLASRDGYSGEILLRIVLR